MPSPHRTSPDQLPPPTTGPVKCADCQHRLTGPPSDCTLVPPDTKYRSITVVQRLWTAGSEQGCADFTPRRLGWFARLLRWVGVR